MPNLNHATGDKETVTKVKKIYSSLNEAFDRAQAIYGDYDTWFKDDDTVAQKSEKLGKRVTEFMKISKDCGLNVNEGCFKSGSAAFLGSNLALKTIESSEEIYKIVTTDGMSLAFSAQYIYVDIDGPNKGPCEAGKDFFLFQTSKDTNDIYYVEAPFPPAGPMVGSYNFINGGFTASGWIIKNENTDYLKADSSGKCNDSNIILNGTTNTSCH